MKFLRMAALLGCLSFLAFSQTPDTSDTSSPPVVPEPNLVLLVAAGLGGIGVVTWRRNRKQ